MSGRIIHGENGKNELRSIKWAENAEALHDLLNEPLEYTANKWGYTKGYIRTQRYRIKKALKEGKITMPEKEPTQDGRSYDDILRLHSINPETIKELANRGFHVGYIKNKEGEIEYTLPLPNAKGNTRKDLTDYEPIEPARITPTRRKRIERASRFILVYGDGQADYRRIIHPVTGEQELVPLHNIPMHNVIHQFNAEFRPHTTVNLGDFADMSSLAKFDATDDHFHKTLGPSMRWIHDFYAQLVADNPDAHHIEVDSNHAVRPKKQVLKNLPALHDFVRPGESYPMMTYYSLANLGRLGIDFISGYGGAEYVHGEEYGAPPIVFKHGTHSSSVPGATVAKEAKENPEVNVVRAHGHHDEEVRRTMRSGRQLFYKMIGSACMNDGTVPGYHSAVDDFNRPVKIRQQHQNTFLLIEDFMNGSYDLSTIDVVNGKAYFNGKEYNGNV